MIYDKQMEAYQQLAREQTAAGQIETARAIVDLIAEVRRLRGGVETDREALGRKVRQVWVDWARATAPDCFMCHGRGVRFEFLFFDPMQLAERPCDHCGGLGRIPKPSHVAPWELISENDREVDRRIGETLAAEGAAAVAARDAPVRAVIVTEGEIEEVRTFNSPRELEAFEDGFGSGARAFGGGSWDIFTADDDIEDEETRELVHAELAKEE